MDDIDVQRIALALPDVVEERRSFRVNGRQFAWPYPERVHPKKARVPRYDIFVILVADQAEKQALLAGEPERFFTTDHYDGAAMLMVRLAEVDESRLAELLADAHAAAVAKGPPKTRRKTK